MKSGIYIGINCALAAEGDILFKHCDCPCISDSCGDLLIRKGTQVAKSEQADLFALIAKLIHCFTHKP